MKTAMLVLLPLLFALAGCSSKPVPPELVSDVAAFKTRITQQNPGVQDIYLDEEGDTITMVISGASWEKLPASAKREITNYLGVSLRDMRAKHGLKGDCFAYVVDNTNTVLARASTISGVELKN